MADIQDKITSVQFSVYTKQEIKALSVKQIINPVAFDNLFRPVKNGLYDPALGVSPFDKFGKCETCGQEQGNCYGHIGHIELAGPVYNPLFFSELVKLLRRKCFNCHRIRITEDKISYLIIKIKLIKLGYTLEADNLMPQMFDFKPKKVANKKAKKDSDSAAAIAFEILQAEDKISYSKDYIMKMLNILKSASIKDIESTSTTQLIALK
jgi:DNA-directed RNA polymerase I subunit RPA1